jgi:hypothetical protein
MLSTMSESEIEVGEQAHHLDRVPGKLLQMVNTIYYYLIPKLL